MEIKKYTIILSLLINLLFGDNDFFIDEYRNHFSNLLVDTMSSIDNFFVDSNETSHNNTHAELSTSIAKESRLDLEEDIRFKIRVNLPKVQKHLKLYIEDEDSDNILYNETQLQKDKLQDNMQNKRYYVRLEFLKFDIKGLTNRLSGGVRIRSHTLVPYANYHSNYKLYEDTKFKSGISNNFRLYTDGGLEDYLSFNTLYNFNNSLRGVWRNIFRYDETPIEIFDTDYSFLYKLDEKKEISLGVGVTDAIKNFGRSKIDNVNLHSSFFHLFHKDWMYYEVSTYLLKREANDYENSYRVFLNLGIYFNTHK